MLMVMICCITVVAFSVATPISSSETREVSGKYSPTLDLKIEIANVVKQFTVRSLPYVHNMGLRLKITFYLSTMGYSQENKMATARRIVSMHALM